MAQKLPRLRMDLDFMPSPIPEQPGLLMRDPYQYSDATLVIPPLLVECLRCLDGESTDLDLREILVRLTGDLRVANLERHLLDSLSAAGFLHDEVYERMKEERQRAFRESPVRAAAHAGGAYPDQADPLRATLDGYLDGAGGPVSGDGVCAIAAPHVSPEGGWESYRSAYAVLGKELGDRVFVILGTSHYGRPERFGLTRKPFATPYGEAQTETSLVDRLQAEAGPAIEMDDYCHATEHSIEFQVVFLQHLYGPNVRILPILCGSYARSVLGEGSPEDDENVRRFLGALGEMSAREKDRLFWVLGVDMAHIGRRYGDPYPAAAGHGVMNEVAERDRKRIARLGEGDANGFWDLVRERQDDLKWCGSAPLYTFLKAVPEARGELLRYQQWNIDAESVVSFAGMAFRRGE